MIGETLPLLLLLPVPAGLNVTFVPDNSDVVSVDDNGKVTAKCEGTATITVKKLEVMVFTLKIQLLLLLV